ncbi:MAG: sigma factor-like helix-turn-helix DNA-binding protein [Chloroflexota bacterium]
MNKHLRDYFSAICQQWVANITHEHAYCYLLEQLLHQLQPGLIAINDPARIAYGVPDFILLRQNIPLGYIEAKGIGTDLNSVVDSEQMRQYRYLLHNLILTNHLDFHWYVGGELRAEARLGRVKDNEITFDAVGAEALLELFTCFFSQGRIGVVAAEVLAQRTAQVTWLMTLIDDTIAYWPLDGEPPEEDGPPDNNGEDPQSSPDNEPTRDHMPDNGQQESENQDADGGTQSVTSDGDLDALLEESLIFSTRVKNLLVRRGIATLRLLLMHTQEQIGTLGYIGQAGLTEIEQVLHERGWQLAIANDPEHVSLLRLLTAALYKHKQPYTLTDLTQRVNYFTHFKQRGKWQASEVAAGAALHPYMVMLTDGRYLLHIRPLDLPLPSPPDDQLETFNDEEGMADDPPVYVYQPFLDDLLEDLGFFSIRVQNALVRHGIITLRLLLMQSPELLLQDVSNFGVTGLTEVENKLAGAGLSLAESPNPYAVMTRTITEAFYKHKGSLSLSDLTHIFTNLSEAKVAQAVLLHPYLVKTVDGRYEMHIQSIGSPTPILPVIKSVSPTEELVFEKDGKIHLSALWSGWMQSLEGRDKEVLFWRYGVQGEDSMTLVEIAEGLPEKVTRERIRQIEQKSLNALANFSQRAYWQPLKNLFSQGLQRANRLMTSEEWERLLDEKAVWPNDNEPRPTICELLCAVFDEFHYIATYHVATFNHITTAHLTVMDKVAKHILRQHKDGLVPNHLIEAIQEELPTDMVDDVYEPAFILKAMNFFERVGLGENGRYIYLRKKKEPRHPTADSGWAGKPGSRLHEWEVQLRQQFEKAAWIGQLSVTESDFQELCQIIRAEAQEPHYFTKEPEGQPRLVPPAVFMTTMVLTARYAEQLSDESLDEFWNPYLRTVWGTTYTQAFMARCRKRFKDVMLYLAKTYDFTFPQHSDGDVVTPVFRHALIPRYMQADFATWLRKEWRDILHMAETPVLLAAQLQDDKSLDHYSHRLKQFVTGKATAETAVALITNIAAAIALHVNDGESIESISQLLADTPIEQELWREVAQVFLEVQESETRSLRQTKARLTWIWSLDGEELALRVQNIIIPAESGLEGEPDRLVWLDGADDDPLEADIEMEVNPWRMQSGERLINDVILAEPDGPMTGRLVLLTDMDEEAERLTIPPQPTGEVQFFRLTQQGAYGIPVTTAQVGEGVWLVWGERPLTFLDEEDEVIEPDEVLPVPYPMDGRYQWAAQITLTLPVTVKAGNKKLLSLVESSSQPAIGRPLLTGSQPIAGLSRQVQPTFASTDITMTFEQGGERLLKQASLWIQGQDGWRWQRPLAELQQQGFVIGQGTKLEIRLSGLLPKRPNFYTVELRFSLQPVLPAPLQFAVVPGLVAIPPAERHLYTPATPPQVSLQGVTETNVVRREGMVVELLANGQQQITWTDLRHEPRLLLRFEQVDIPLAWSVPHFMAWLEPQPDKPFLTLEELQRTTLQAIGSSAVTEFTLFVSGQRGRTFPLKRGRYRSLIGHSQLYDMVRIGGGEQAVVVKAQVGSDVWTLFTVRQRPSLARAYVEYDKAEQMVLFHTGLTEDWRGNGRFVAESLTNPFAPLVELARRNVLQDLHILPANLPSGIYLFRLELDGGWLALSETAVRFTVGEDSDELVHAQQLVQEIRRGQLISHQLAEDFVLWWAELAEADEATLTPSTLFQLATVPAKAVENFGVNHLQKLWSPLAALQKVQNTDQWIEVYGYLPAWILLPHAVTLKTAERNFQLRVYPMQAMEGGRKGRGYGRWRLSHVEDSPKTAVFVEWQAVSTMQVQVEAGIPDEVPEGDWTAVDLLDSYALHFCTRCGRLTGAKAIILPDDILQAHTHSQATADLRNITVPPEHGGHRLLADYIPERRGDHLLHIYDTYEVVCPLAIAHLPEPPLSGQKILNHSERRTQLLALLREVKRYGMDSEPLGFWGSVARLLSRWQGEENVEGVSVLGQTAVALGILLRTAAYQPNLFDKLRKEANLAEMDVHRLLADLNQNAPEHVQWGLTWAELLYRHSYTRFA